MDRPDTAAIRQRAAVATPGPWRWRGNVDIQNIHLSSITRGLNEVMDFTRWGMQRARPRFANADRFKGEFSGGWMQDADQFAVYQVCPEAASRADPRVYRGDIIDLRHPDAEFIAHARQDIDDLLAYIDALRERNERLRQAVIRADAVKAWIEPDLIPDELAAFRVALDRCKEHGDLDPLAADHPVAGERSG